MVCPFLVERRESQTLGSESIQVLEFVVCWEVLLSLIYRNTFKVRDFEFYFIKHISSVTVEQQWQFPDYVQSVLYV